MCFESSSTINFFEPVEGGTVMRDALRFSAPLGWLGALAERLVLRRHMECFLRERNGALRSTAEGDESGWRVFLAADRI